MNFRFIIISVLFFCQFAMAEKSAETEKKIEKPVEAEKSLKNEGPTEVKPSMDKEAIRRKIQENLRSFRACYERLLNKNPDLSGKWVGEWVITEGGKAKSAKRVEAKSSISKNDELDRCMIDLIQGIK